MVWSELARTSIPGKIANCLECFPLEKNCSHCGTMDAFHTNYLEMVLNYNPSCIDWQQLSSLALC